MQSLATANHLSTHSEAGERADIIQSDTAAAMQVLRWPTVDLNLGNVYHFLGLRPEVPRHRPWFEAVREHAQALSRLIRARCMFRVDEVRRLEARRLELASKAVFEGAVGQFLAHSRYVATFVVTIGSALERLGQRRLKGNHMMAGMIINAIASEATEAAAERCQQAIREWARAHGMEITPRYSPGYCGMDIRQQIPLFGGLETRAINVRLTPSCLMLPIKSVSALVGMGPAELISPAVYPCERCDRPWCMQRRSPHRPDCGTSFDWRAEDKPGNEFPAVQSGKAAGMNSRGPAHGGVMNSRDPVSQS